MNSDLGPQKVLDYDEAVNLLEKAIGVKGEDYVYEIDGKSVEGFNSPHTDSESAQCLYFHNGAPSCIVGHVMDFMGYDSETFLEGLSAKHAISRLGIEADAHTLALLEVIQEQQDCGVAWGLALEEAQRRVPRW